MTIGAYMKGKIQQCMFCGGAKVGYQPTCGARRCVSMHNAERRRRQREDARRGHR